MSEKKTYKRYKEDPFVKAPALAWMMDRPKAMLPVIGVGVLSIGAIIGTGWQSYANITAPPEDNSPYADVTPVSYQGKTWALELIASQPDNVDAWEVSENYRGRPIVDTEEYGSPAQQLPNSLLMTASATGSGVTTRVQVYGAGQGAEAFDNIQQEFEESTNYTPTVESVSQSRILRFADGFLVNTGDAIVGVTASDETMLDALETFYIPEIESTIAESECSTIHPRSTDYQRSFFYDRDDYTGLLERENIVTEVNYEGLPTPSNLTLLSVENPSAIAPEAPLPESFDEFPEDRERPGLQSRPDTRDSFEQVAEYQVEDQNGPGCGWAWTAYEQPVHDLQQLAQDQEDTLESTQQAVNTEALEYVNMQRSWALNMAGNMPVINQWNRHVNKINSVHADWQQLREGRNAIRSDWYNFVESHNAWSEFPAQQREAREDHEEALEQCLNQQEELEEWQDEYGNFEEEQEAAREEYETEVEEWEERQAEREREAAEEASPSESESPSSSPSSSPSETPSPSGSESPSPSPSETPSPSAVPTPSSDPSPTFENDEDIPERPDGCETPPERPSILDEDRGDEPTPPDVPEDITIPNSWPTPENDWTPPETEEPAA